ncbi:DUF1579 family protein [Roseivirga sp. BDSF3-8]|uniref:DUF1579 family protein n=1 Tax=Roseivirga sp. BDSF3-8 TaxID=3241598 RepID=UPI00353223C4
MQSLYLLAFMALFSFTEPSATGAGYMPPETLYDFWIGEWDLTWTDRDGEQRHGENTVRKIMGGKVIEENFHALDGGLEGFEGKSWSVYDTQTGLWKQTWVDNHGSYLDFEGRTEGDKRIFYRVSTDTAGNERHARMVFYHIREDSLDWDWQVSGDRGGTWETVWQIAYRRKR